VQKAEHTIMPPLVSRLVNDDLNTSALIAYIQSLEHGQEYFGQNIIDEIKEADGVLGLDLFGHTPEEVVVTPELQKLRDARQRARDTKNFTESDHLRDEIRRLGYEVKDTPGGQRFEKI